MPRYFFDIHDGTDMSVDQTGTDLVDIREARNQAAKALVDLAAASFPPRGQLGKLTVRVRSPHDQHLLAITIQYSESPPDWMR